MPGNTEKSFKSNEGFFIYFEKNTIKVVNCGAKWLAIPERW
jgi:hypothetical protein